MKKRTRTSKRILLCGLVILVVAVGASIFFVNRNSKPLAELTATSADAPINYDPPTEEEKRQAEDRKDEIVRQQHEPQTDTNGKKQVTVSISTPEKVASLDVVVTGVVQGVVEDGGTCSVILQKGGDERTAKSKGFADASTTSCSPMSLQLSPGSWRLALAYDSSTASGSTSKTIAVE